MSLTLHAVAGMVEPWARVYRDHTSVETGVAFAHIAGLLAAGGFAVAADRATLRAAKGGPELRQVHLSELGAIHRPVLIGLIVVALSGVLLFTADIETYAVSVAFWVKMGLIALLLVNGLRLSRAEAALRSGQTEPSVGWRKLRGAAIASLVLWFTVTLAGTFLTNAA